jgi:hypothetical protein
MKLLDAYSTFGPGHCDYEVNSQGYRCPEFESIDWNESILMFGCSHTFGIGIEDNETVAHQLSLLVERPVINLGMGGSSYSYQWINSTILRKNNVSPRTVIYLWPEYSRQSIFYNNDRNQTRSVGFWSIDSKPNYKDPGVGLVLDPFHSKHMSSYIRDNLDVLWSCSVLHYTFADSGIGIPLLISMLDRAKDGSHAGPVTNASWARSIANDLKNKC